MTFCKMERTRRSPRSACAGGGGSGRGGALGAGHLANDLHLAQLPKVEVALALQLRASSQGCKLEVPTSSPLLVALSSVPVDLQLFCLLICYVSGYKTKEEDAWVFMNATLFLER